MINEGAKKIKWARNWMKILGKIRERFLNEKPLEGVRISMAMHVEAKTAVLALTLRDAGAEIAITSCNPLSTDDDVAYALQEMGVKCYARRGQNREEYYEAINRTLDIEPNIIIDDGGDLTVAVIKRNLDIWGGSEETTTGVIRLKSMEKRGVLPFPMFDVNDAYMKHLFDNRYGTGQSTIDGIMSATNLVIAGKNVVVAGYGWCGRGIAMRMRGMGANVIVCEVNPFRAVEALMDGFRVMKMSEAIKLADMVITATGVKDVVRGEHIENAKDGVILANAGHFDNEINKKDLESMAVEIREVRKNVREYLLKNGKRVYLLADGRLVNLVAGQGHPVEIMDLSFSLQALVAEYIAKNREKLEPKVYAVPREIDEFVAKCALEVRGVEIDSLTEEQMRYIESWEVGT